MNDCCNDAELQPLLSMLRYAAEGNVESSLEDLDAVDGFSNRLSDVVKAYNNVLILCGPPVDFAEYAWPCLVEALCERSYYFTIDEILLICMAAAVASFCF